MKPGGRDRDEADPEAEAAAAPDMMIPVGTVHLVNEPEGFILIQSGRFRQIEPGTRLHCHGPDGTLSATVRAGTARKGSFVVADMESGLPRRDDRVLMDHAIRRPGGDPGAADVQVLE